MQAYGFFVFFEEYTWFIIQTAAFLARNHNAKYGRVLITDPNAHQSEFFTWDNLKRLYMYYFVILFIAMVIFIGELLMGARKRRVKRRLLKQRRRK